MPSLKLYAIPSLALILLPLPGMAETLDSAELQMFREAKLDMTQAGQAALGAHPGTLAALEFGDEDGTAAWRAVVVGADQAPWTVLVDAPSGAVLAMAKSALITDPADEPQRHGKHDGADDEDDAEEN